jgi:predicted Zn finger-like uncharacterized protein
MLIVCPSCATAYNVEAANLPPAGRQVRCLRCRTVWHAGAPSHADKLLAAAADIAPGAAMAEPIVDEFAEEPALPVEQPVDEGSWPMTVETDVVAAAEDAPATVEAPPIAPVDLDAGQPPVEIEHEPAADAEPLEDIETYAARRNGGLKFKRPVLRWPLSGLQSCILVLLIADAILVGWRNDVVRILPQTASFYAELGLPVNLRGLSFDGITTSTEQHEGVPILVVEGNVVNDTRKLADVPRLKFVVRNDAHEEIYSWTTVASRPSLPPGEAVSFRSRLASPPLDGRDVLVRFVTRHDIIAGTR